MQLRQFLTKRKMTWPQIVESGREGPIGKLYRVEGYPSYWLIDQKGMIAKLDVRGPGLAQELERLLPRK